MAKETTSQKKKKVKLAEVEIVEGSAVSPRKINLHDVSIEEKIQQMIEATKTIRDFELIKSYMINYNEVIDKRLVATNEGTRVQWEDM
ncbi:MAG: TldD/PmbA family protein, partial [Candidatus Heimdallarchaeaceae archaeon]